MGMYTELYLGVELSKDTDEGIVKWLSLHNKGDEITFSDIRLLAPTELAGTRLDVLSGSSYYFDALPHFQFEYDDISKSYHLTLGLNIKNYSNEIDTFLKILEPYITSIGHIGHTRYEEEEVPTLLYCYDNVITTTPKNV